MKMKMEEMHRSTNKSAGKANGQYETQKNGAYTDKSRGNGLGIGMQDLIGTEKVENPIKGS